MLAHAGGPWPARMLHAGASMATPASRRTLGHLGHLGHGFKLQAWPCMPVDLGSFGSLILRNPNDPKAGAGARRSFKALGHLGHLVIDLKSAPVAALTTRAWFCRY